MGIRIWDLFLKQKKGFTLVELLVVVSIMTILALVSLSTFSNQNRRARDSRRMADLEQIRNALEMFRLNQPTRVYPDFNGNVSDLQVPLQNFIAVIPQDPSRGTAQYRYQSTQPTNIEYVLCAHLEDPGVIDDTRCNVFNNDCGLDCNYAVENP